MKMRNIYKRAILIAVGTSFGITLGQIVYRLIWPPCSDALIAAAYYLDLELNCDVVIWQNIVVSLVGAFVVAFLITVAVEWIKSKLKDREKNDSAAISQHD